MLHSSIAELQAQQRQDVWFQSSNVLSRQVALQDTSLTPRQAEKKYEDTIYELHGELVKPQPSRESKGEIFLDPNSQLHPAIVFLVGSGPNSTHTGLYTDFVRENLEQIFLQHGVALMYFDKRGLAYLKDVGIAPTYPNGLMMLEPRCNFYSSIQILIPSVSEWWGIPKAGLWLKYWAIYTEILWLLSHR